MLQGEHSAILSTFIKLPVAIRIFVWSIFEWLFDTGFTVCQLIDNKKSFIKRQNGSATIEYPETLH